MRMLFDYFETDRLIVCMDPGAIDLLQDFCGDRSVSKLLEVQCNFTDEYLIGHAMRVGLAGEQTPKDTLARLLPTIRSDMDFESDRIRDEEFENHFIFRESDSSDHQAELLTRFLGITYEKARQITEADHLFAD
jgi:hypothetical protein